MGPSFERATDDERRALPCELGRFVLLRELGAGGMATVYLGKMRLAEGLERLVAVKLIHDELADQSAFVDMFLDEARIASLITHPNVCGVHDFGHADGTYFLAMEYLVGEPVSEIIREVWEQRHDAAVMGALPYLAARIVADACEGLHAAHETRGADGRWLEVVHRDVSPQNLFVTYEGAVKVVDFGCAKALQRITETNAGIFKGKVAYAAPEQLKIEKLDARTDVWALGAVLWEALTLERVFKRDTPMQTARAILEEAIPRVDEIDPDVPPELADIVERALTRDKRERFPSARELGRALRTFIAAGGASFESAELAEWMDFLFAGRRARLLRMVEEAERSLASAHASHVAPSPAALLASSTFPEAQPPTLEQPLDAAPQPRAPVAHSRRPEGLGPATRMAASHAPLVRESGREVLEDEPATVATASSPGLEPAPRGSRPPTRGLRLDAADRQGPVPRSRGSLFWALLAAAAIVVGALGVGAALTWPEPASSPAGGDHGTVIVQAATGSADVYRDGHHLGRTPLTLQLPAGPQRLVLRGFGRGASEEVVVPVTAGTTSRITVRPR